MKSETYVKNAQREPRAREFKVLCSRSSYLLFDSHIESISDNKFKLMREGEMR